MAASNAADWFAGSMTAAAVIVALGGYGFAEWQRRRDKKDAERQSGRLIGVKLMKVMNGTDDIRRHIWADYNGPPLGGKDTHELWRTIQPLVGLQDDPALALNDAETNLLIQAGATSFLMELMLVTFRYQSIVSSMKEYQLRYDALYQLSPAPVAMQGQVGQHILTHEQYMRMQPYSLALEALIQRLKAMTAENVDMCRRLAREYQPIMKRYFKAEKFLALIDPMDYGDSALNA